MRLKSLEELEQYLNSEIMHQDRYIFRFINVNSIAFWLELKKMLTQRCFEIKKISSFCFGEDLTPNINRLCAELETIKDNTLLIPLSEHLRINHNEKEETLAKLININFNEEVFLNKKRLYIPMFRMENCLKKILSIDQRLENHLLFLETETDEEKYSVKIVSQDLESAFFGENRVFGYKGFLEYWEGTPGNSVIIFTGLGKLLKRNVFPDDVEVFLKSFDVIKQKNLFDFEIKEEFGEEWQWRQFLELTKGQKSSSDFFNDYFGTKLTKFQLLESWLEYNDFKKWLSWLWLKGNSSSQYLNSVLSQENKYTNFIKDLTCGLIKYSKKDLNFDKLYSERRELLKALKIRELPWEFWEELKGIPDNEKIFYLTDNTRKERETIIELIGKTGSIDSVRGILKNSYPELYHYLEEYVFEDETISNYFNEYKSQKLQNHFSQKFLELVSKLGDKKGVWWKLSSRNNLVEKNYDSQTIIYLVDGMGFEYISLIQYLLENKFKSVFYKVQIGYSNIPTITELNKDFIEGRKFEINRDLDQLKHNCEYPKGIENELEIVKEAVREAVNFLEIYDKVILVSDHGFSRGAILAKGKSHKPYPEAKVERFGRYCIHPKATNEEIYNGCILNGKYHVFANYDRFSIGGNEQSEIHGGATLEEVLVPIFVMSKTPLEEKVKITVLEEEIKLRPGVLPKVKFKIDKNYSEVIAVVDGKQYKCIMEGEHWFFEPEVGKKDYYKVNLFSKGKIGEFSYKIIKGSTESDKFDI